MGQLKKLEKVLAVTALSLSFSLGMAYDVHAMVGGKPVIGISWKSNKQDYAAFKKIIELAGGVPVELGQIKSTDVKYDSDGAVDKSALEKSGMLKQKYANKIKAKDFAKTNIATVMQGVDGVFGTGGEDISRPCTKMRKRKRTTGKGSTPPGIFPTIPSRPTAWPTTSLLWMYAAANRCWGLSPEPK